jgi:hypothetical protein
MSMRGFRRWVGLWWAATIHGIARAWFGWGAVAAAAFIAFLQQQPDLKKNLDRAPWWVLPVASVFAALLAVSLIHAVVIAPYRAWRMLNPFKTKIVSGILKSEYPAEPVERQRAAVLIENNSYRQHSNRVLHIQTVSDFDNQHHSFPRFIKEFSVQSGETQQIEFLTWVSRKAPLENDKAMVLCGPVGGVGWQLCSLAMRFLCHGNQNWCARWRCYTHLLQSMD